MRKLIPIFLLTTILYLLMIYFSAPIMNFDAKSYNVIGVLTLNKISIYPDPAISRHPYLPLFLYLEAGAQGLSQIIHIPQLTLLKCFFTLFHLFSIYSIFILSKKNIKTTVLYALNPISLLIIAFHGQFDIIPLSLILYSIVLLQEKKYALVFILLGVAFTLKTWPALFIVPFFKRVPKKFCVWFLIPPIAIVILYILLFNTSLFSIARVLAVYQGVGGIWGFGKVLSFISASKIVLFIYKLFFVSSLIFYSFKLKKTSPIEEISSLLLFFFIFTPGFGIQWFLWLVPSFFLSKKPFLMMLYIPMLIALIIGYATWIPFIPISENTNMMIIGLVYPLFPLYLIVQKILPQTKR